MRGYHRHGMHWQSNCKPPMMMGSHWRGRGWFFPPFGLLLAGFMIFLLLKSGFWIPLLVIGIAWWFSRQRGGWQPIRWTPPSDEKRKNEDAPESEKPKRYDDEYV